ncbi:MAG: hypothetical protein IKP12_03965 [Acholeplasmatales bacterium]|nr:hypothetical protein [Acholeplasmatales bacterium]
MANNKNNNTYKKEEKKERVYSNPVKSPVGKIIVTVLALAMLSAGLVSLIYAIVQYVLHG